MTIKKKKVLIIAPLNDVHALAVSNKINQTPDAECIIWDTGSQCNEWRLTYEDGMFCINIGNTKLKDQDIHSIWWRRPQKIKFPTEIVDPQAKRHINDSHNSLLYAFLHTMERRTVNSVTASYRADDKALQLLVAKSCGLSVPNTIVSNNYEQIFTFTSKLEKVVVKPLTMLWGCFAEACIIDKDFVKHHRQEIELTPTIYQEIIDPAIDLRVTVIGDKIITARIKKNNPVAKESIDWRLDVTSECISEELPETISKKILLFMRELGLTYGAIDLRRTEDGTYYFLEVNTAGQYLWVEIDTGLPISSALGTLLLNIENSALA
ncbi:hypothetical protein P4310_17400 [Bacillus thuringiensis]|uniref:hypothetical protein n=1 Tax=Bacillus thuringiensis TaxID=1428 RepID=UPI000A3997AB|nr:hypothetical protein [Bacillus thuringiensis]EKS7845858.1 hypothetical protein [Bacillus cereus]MED3067314.1 hypothetical protein [Bacillus thuringiensis]OUB38272.1 hypothetical protein BK737_00405 [Bacillus thuringiensis serovar palmanyolensis]HDR4543716.1 hypothetical protein [Bacillus cereus]HDR4845766.1 hypothetical protein [Bacillus cereus]